MTTLIHADIFFFISTIALGIFTIGMVIVGIFIILIMKDMKRISATISKESTKIAHDIDDMRDVAKAEGIKIKSIADFFLDLFLRRQRHAKIKRTMEK